MEHKGLLDVSAAIIFEKDFQQRQPDYNDFDAIIFNVMNHKSVTQQHYRNFEYMPNMTMPIQVTEHILLTQDPIEYAEKTRQIVRMTFTLSSETQNIAHIRAYVSQCRRDYEYFRNNKLGTDIYYFDQTPSTDMRFRDAVVFEKQKYSTCRSFRNIFFDDKDKIMNRVKHFLTRPDWYNERGIPHTLGLALYGKPGCGKTSLIKALAGESKRHVFNIKLGGIKSATQLKNLFYNPVIQVYNTDNLSTEKFTVPINQRLYIIEDIDCMIDIVGERSNTAATSADAASTVGAASAARAASAVDAATLENKRKKPQVAIDGDEEVRAYFEKSILAEEEEMKREKKDEESNKDDVITLDSLLAILDGTMEIPGRMLVITTNMIEKIDSAVRRPGRIDHIIEFRPASKKIAWELTCAFHNTKFNANIYDKMREYVVTPAVINQILFQYMENPETAIEEIIRVSNA